MEVKSRTSFIPRRETASGQRESALKSINLLAVLAALAFLAAVSLSVGVFVYQKALIKKIDAMNSALVKAKESFDPSFIDEAITLDKRIETAKEILKKHISASAVFDLLEKETLENVRFKTFSYTLGPKGQVGLSMAGEATSFNTVALQSDVFGGDKMIKNPIFYNLNLDERGNVTFQFKAVLDPKLVLYRNRVVAESGGGELSDEEETSGAAMEPEDFEEDIFELEEEGTTLPVSEGENL